MDIDPDSKKRRCFIDPCQSEILQGISTEHRLQQITYCNSSGSFATLVAIRRASSRKDRNQSARSRSACRPSAIWPYLEGALNRVWDRGVVGLLGLGPAAQTRFHRPIAERSRYRALLP